MPYLCPIERKAVDTSEQSLSENPLFADVLNATGQQRTPVLAFVKHRSSVQIRPMALENAMNQKGSWLFLSQRAGDLVAVFAVSMSFFA